MALENMKFPEEWEFFFSQKLKVWCTILFFFFFFKLKKPTHDTVSANGGPMGRFGHAELSKCCELLLNEIYLSALIL